METKVYSDKELSLIINGLYERLNKADNADVSFHLAQRIAHWEEQKVLASAHKMCQTNHKLTQQEEYLLLNGQKIEAIKSVRTRTGMCLSDAKSLVDSYNSL